MPKKVLLADDSITIQKVIGITFANEDIALTTVDNGADAIATAKRVRPDLILADVVMPGKNGYEVCEYVKHSPDLRGTPVLLLAGTFESFDEAEMARVGADGYITKPFESQTLIDKVHELISRAQPDKTAASAAPAQAARVGRPAPPRPAPAPVAAAAPPVDEFNLTDFSPFQEPSPAGAAPEAEVGAVDEGASDWGAVPANGAGDDDVWDLSDFEAGAEGDTAEALFAEAEASIEGDADGHPAGAFGAETSFGEEEAVPLEAAPVASPSTSGIVGEQEYDFGDTATETAGDFPADGGELDLDAATDAFQDEAQAAAQDDPFGVDPFANGDFATESADFAPEGAEGDGAEALELTEFEEVEDVAPEADSLADDLVAPDAADGWEVAAVDRVAPPAAARPEAPAPSGVTPHAMGALAGRIKTAADGLATQLNASRVGIPAEQVEAIVARVAREVIEEVAWEVVPDLCEELIRAEIRKMQKAR
jgi:CheY-like chemotaxis protein